MGTMYHWLYNFLSEYLIYSKRNHLTNPNYKTQGSYLGLCENVNAMKDKSRGIIDE